MVLGVASTVGDQLFKQHRNRCAFVIQSTGGEAVALEVVVDDVFVAEDRNEREVRVVVRVHFDVPEIGRCLIEYHRNKVREPRAREPVVS